MGRYIDLSAAKTPAPLPVEDPPEARALLDELGRRMLKRRVDALKSLPTFPQSILRINQVLSAEAPDESFREIVAIIETDPVLVARILRLVNSAFYGVSGAVATVQDALVMVGLDVVKGLILSAHAMDMLADRRGMRGLWEHSFGTAIAAASLGRVCGVSRLEEVSAAALMHDLGKVVLATQLAEDYAEVVDHAMARGQHVRDAERALLGVTHDEIGRWLVTRWKLPPSLAEPIAWHHSPEQARRFPEATAIVHVADLVVRGFGFGFAGDAVVPEVSEHAWRLLGLNAHKLEQAVDRTLPRLHAAMARANFLGSAG